MLLSEIGGEGYVGWFSVVFVDEGGCPGSLRTFGFLSSNGYVVRTRSSCVGLVSHPRRSEDRYRIGRWLSFWLYIVGIFGKGDWDGGLKASRDSIVRPLFVSSIKASIIRVVVVLLGCTSFIPGVCWSIARLMISLMLLQFGLYHPVPCPVPWR